MQSIHMFHAPIRIETLARCRARTIISFESSEHLRSPNDTGITVVLGRGASLFIMEVNNMCSSSPDYLLKIISILIPRQSLRGKSP